MKTRLLFLTILFSFLLTSVVWAQCPPGNIIFTTQAQVDAFAVDFPNCTEIGGSLDISGSDITDLSPLQNLTQIGGSLTIDHNDQLKSLDGLENIQNVGLHLFIYKNNQLISLDALQNLSMISGYVEIRENANLSSLSGLENLQKVSDNLTIYKNNQLVSLESLQNLTMIGGYLIISENASLTSISGLDNLQTISDNLTIHNNDLLGSIEGLQNLTQIGGYLYIEHNDQLTSLDGLENLQNVGVDLFIHSNNLLVSLEGLQNLTQVGGYLYIGNNPSLPSLNGLQNLVAINGDLKIPNNAQLLTLQGLQNLNPTTISFLELANNPNLSYCSLENICTYLSDPDNPRTISGNSGDCADIAAVQNDCNGGNNTGPGTGFITTWKTNNSGSSGNNQITIPTEGTGYNYNIYWEEVGNSDNSGSATGITGDHTITFSSEGTYQVEITGDFPRIFFNREGDKDKILTIDQWGNIAWSSMESAFAGCTHVQGNATDAPDLSNVTSTARMFLLATEFNQDLNNWNVSNITDMNYMFNFAESFNGNISSWDVSKVKNFEAMFRHAKFFNQDISGWETESAEDMQDMFSTAQAFNQDISGWDVSSVHYMVGMFSYTNAFNQDISNWDVSNVEYMNEIFREASAFNQNIGEWDVSKVKAMVHLLANTALSTANYDATLIGWAAQDVQPNVTLGAEGLTYCAAVSARQSLIDKHGWNISSDMIVSEDCGMVVYVRIKNDSTISIPSYGSDSFQQLKQKIKDRTGIDTKDQTLYFNNMVMGDGRTLEEFNVQHGSIIYLNPNENPTVANPIPDQSAAQDILFTFQFAANTFADLDEDDVLTYTAQLAGGGNLPSWLSFTTSTRTFTGTPGNNDVGAIHIEVMANDGKGGTVSDTFTLTVGSRPTVTITTLAPFPTNEPFSVDIEFSEAVTGFIAVDVEVTNGMASDLATTDNVTYQILVTPTADGPVSVQVPENVAQNINSVSNAASNEIIGTYDQTDPLVVTRDITVFLDTNGGVSIDVDAVDNGSSDAGGIATRILSESEFDCSDLGYNFIELKVTDDAGNMGSAMATVTVVDTLDPVPSNQSLTDFTGECKVNLYDLTLPTANDNCSGSITGTTDATFPITTVGTTTITWTYEDDEGNSVTQNQDIIVEPCPRIAVSVEQLTGITAECSTLFSDLTLPTTVEVTFDNSTNQSVSVTWQAGNYNPSTGIYTISGTLNLTGIENPDNLTAALTITVRDTEDPVPSNQSLTDFTGECQVNLYDLTPPTANDNCSGSITGTTDATFPITTVGTTTITWTYEDDEGNSVTQNQDIIVEPCPKIAVSVEQLTGITAECSTLFSDLTLPPTVEVTFDNSTNQSVSVTWQAGNYNPSIGIYPISGTLNLTGIENPDNLTAALTITVRDSEDPVPSSQSLTDFTGECQVNLFDLTPPTADDNCSGSITGTTDATFPITTQGTTTITWTFEDDAGNVVTQTQKIVIKDATAPVPDVDQLEVITVECSAGISVFPTATDHCAGQITATTDDPLQYNQKGNYTITWMYDDGHGNTSTQLQTVTVTNSSEPVMICPQRRIVSCDPIVTFELPEAMNDCGSVAVIQTDDTGLSSGSVFPVGITTLRYKTSDPNSSVTCLIEIEVLPDLVVKHRSGIGFGDTLHIPVCLPPSISKENLDLGPHQDRASVRSSIYKGNLPANPEFGLWKLSLYTYQVEDQCENSEYFENYVALYDIAPPIFLSFPNDTTVDTPADLPPVPTHSRNVRIIDICRYVAWDTVITEPIPDPVNHDTIAFVRRWIAEDEVGNKSFRDQMIYVRSTSPADFNSITAHIVREEDLTGQRFIHTAGTDNIQVTLYKLDIPHGSLLPVDSMFSGNWMGSRGNLFFTSLHPGAYRLKINLPQGYTPYHPDSLIFEDGWSDTMFLSGDSTLHLGTTLLIPGIVPDTSSTIPPDVGGIGQDAGPQNDRFMAYPNPTTGRIRLSLPSGKGFEYTVYNHLGKVEVSGTTLNGSEIDLSGRTDGLYFISVENGNEFRATQRILILSSQ